MMLGLGLGELVVKPQVALPVIPIKGLPARSSIAASAISTK